ncbi:hypothetical protein D1818_23965 [Aquimarina sp. BL5]|nr:hypothetical protein D1818_23965 [Aquimarina sp. BL5]RKN06785.1 hypothetical protein D7036_08455 [Aquimarina sp. BL5]
MIINGLSKNIKEISGITKFTSDTLLYAINDSGNDNTLFCLNQKGKIVKKLKIPNSKNVDWEDLAYDHQNNLYIGDFGNNYNNRKDLSIYKVSNIFSDNIEVSKIEFSLEDQKKFPPGKKNKNFDIEAFIYRNGSFYLFTKNRSSKFDGVTKLYKVSDTPGKQIATLIGSYKTCDDSNDCFISGAAINSTADKIALLTYNKIFILSDFKDDNLFNGRIKKIKLNHFSQKEGICFKNDSTLLIVDEKRKNMKGRLYEYRIK